MSPSLCITNARIVIPGERIVPGSLSIADGKISSVQLSLDGRPEGATVMDAGGRLLTPGLIDLHTHGLHRWMYENGAEDLLKIAGVLGATGTTCTIPTIVPGPRQRLLRQLEDLTGALGRAGVAGAAMPGLHLEGPFVALTGAACNPCSGDVGYLKEMLAAAAGRVTAMSISPEVPGILPVIEHLRANGAAAFMTHTAASVEQTEAAIAAGARHATHFYDVFPQRPEIDGGVRPCGAVEAILADRSVSVDFICDGCHVHPVAVRAALAAKGYEGVCLISDSNIGAGMTPGIYPTPWGYPVRVKDGDGARIADPAHRYANCLAGSALTMDEGMRNLFKWLNLPAEQVWAMGTSNPARVANLSSKGAIAAGADADLVLWNADLTVHHTWMGGRTVYQA